MVIHVYEWNHILIREASNSNFIEFTNKVMIITYMVIDGINLPRMAIKGKEWMQFAPETRVGDLFILNITQL